MKFDLEKTAELERLFQVPREERADTWREAFFAAVPDASMATGEAQVVGGPDGFPYFRLLLPEPAAPFETFCVTHILDVCLDNGFGVVVMGRDPNRPEWVFRYGDLWSFKETGQFLVPPEGPPADPSGPVLVGSPSDAILPPNVRAVLRRALEAQGAQDPGVLGVHAANAVPARSLAFRPMPDPHRLLWYLPSHVGLLAVQDGWPEPMPL